MEATDKFIDSFVETGDYLVSMKEAGYKDKNPYQLQMKGRKLDLRTVTHIS